MPTQIDLFDSRFRSLHERSFTAVGSVQVELVYKTPGTVAAGSFGEYLLRSAGSVEQTFGGITTRLWDDPFEWTLPEELSTPEKIKSYLDEVEATRQKGFRSFTSDEDLMKQIPAPETLTPIFDLLLQTLARAEHYQGHAFAVLQMISDVPLPRSLVR